MGPINHPGLGHYSLLGRRRVEQKRSSKERGSVGEKSGCSCLDWTNESVGIC